MKDRRGLSPTPRVDVRSCVKQQREDDHCADGSRGCGKLTHMDGGDTKEHTDAIGDEPEQPYGDTQPMETAAPSLVVTDDDDGGPGGVEEHERDGDDARDSMKGYLDGTVGLCDDAHERGASRIADEPEPEEHEMRRAQRSRPSFPEHADGVEDKRRGDREYRSYQQRIHRGSFLQILGGGRG